MPQSGIVPCNAVCVALIEPVSILFIGLVIGFIMVGVVLAMTSLTEVKL